MIMHFVTSRKSPRAHTNMKAWLQMNPGMEGVPWDADELRSKYASLNQARLAILEDHGGAVIDLRLTPRRPLRSFLTDEVLVEESGMTTQPPKDYSLILFRDYVRVRAVHPVFPWLMISRGTYAFSRRFSRKDYAGFEIALARAVLAEDDVLVTNGDYITHGADECPPWFTLAQDTGEITSSREDVLNAFI